MELVYLLFAGLGVFCGFTVGALETRWYKKQSYKPANNLRDYGSADEANKKDALSASINKQLKIDEATKENSHRFLLKTCSLAAILAVFFPLIVFFYGEDGQSTNAVARVFAYLALGSILCVAIATDLDTMTIPNTLVGAAFIVWLSSVWFMQPLEYGVGNAFDAWIEGGFSAVAADGLAAAFLIGGGILVFSAVYEQVSGKQSLGGGDIKLLCAVTLFLGIYASLLTIFLACLFGLLFAPLWRAVTRQSSPTFPFAPSIACATLVILVALPFMQ